MGTFEVDTVINAPVETVWDLLAGNIGTISEWNPGVQESHVLEGSDATGLGSKRYCDLGSKKFLKEEVVTFDAQEYAITFRITDTNLPFERADIRFQLRSRGFDAKTLVSCSPDYKLKYAFVGSCLDSVFVRRTYKNGMENLLAGLKNAVEGTSS